jgi:hypothetical protein
MSMNGASKKSLEVLHFFSWTVTTGILNRVARATGTMKGLSSAHLSPRDSVKITCSSEWTRTRPISQKGSRLDSYLVEDRADEKEAGLLVDCGGECQRIRNPALLGRTALHFGGKAQRN